MQYYGIKCKISLALHYLRSNRLYFSPTVIHGICTFYRAEALNLEKTVLDNVADVVEDWRIDDIKGLLGRCNFRDDMLDRKVRFLSGGEKVMCILL